MLKRGKSYGIRGFPLFLLFLFSLSFSQTLSQWRQSKPSDYFLTYRVPANWISAAPGRFPIEGGFFLSGWVFKGNKGWGRVHIISSDLGVEYFAEDAVTAYTTMLEDNYPTIKIERTDTIEIDHQSTSSKIFGMVIASGVGYDGYALGRDKIERRCARVMGSNGPDYIEVVFCAKKAVFPELWDQFRKFSDSFTLTGTRSYQESKTAAWIKNTNESVRRHNEKVLRKKGILLPGGKFKKQKEVGKKNKKAKSKKRKKKKGHTKKKKSKKRKNEKGSGGKKKSTIANKTFGTPKEGPVKIEACPNNKCLKERITESLKERRILGVKSILVTATFEGRIKGVEKQVLQILTSLEKNIGFVPEDSLSLQIVGEFPASYRYPSLDGEKNTLEKVKKDVSMKLRQKNLSGVKKIILSLDIRQALIWPQLRDDLCDKALKGVKANFQATLYF